MRRITRRLALVAGLVSVLALVHFAAIVMAFGFHPTVIASAWDGTVPCCGPMAEGAQAQAQPPTPCIVIGGCDTPAQVADMNRYQAAVNRELAAVRAKNVQAFVAANYEVCLTQRAWYSTIPGADPGPACVPVDPSTIIF